MTVFHLGSTMSGDPGRSLRCKRKRYPAPCKTRRTKSSGLVFLFRTRLTIGASRFGAQFVGHLTPYSISSCSENGEEVVDDHMDGLLRFERDGDDVRLWFRDANDAVLFKLTYA